MMINHQILEYPIFKQTQHWTLKRLASIGTVQRAAGCQEAEYSDDLEEDPFDEDEEVRRFASKMQMSKLGTH